MSNDDIVIYPVHKPHLQLRLPLHQHQRTRLHIPRMALPSSLHSAHRTSGIRSVRRETSIAGDIAVCAIGVVDDDGGAIETGCAGPGGEGVCGAVEEGVEGG